MSWLGMTPAPVTYREPVRAWLVLEQSPSPTTDYYVRSRAAQAGVPVRYRDIRVEPSAEDVSPGTLVIVVRYVSSAWVKMLRARQSSLAGVIYLLDDDLFDAQSWRGLPLGYQWRLWQHHRALRPLWRQLVSAYWVSTTALAQRYPHLRAQVMPPLPLPEDVALPQVPGSTGPTSAGKSILLFYHGTRSHLADMMWLRPAVEYALAKCPHLYFEIIGNEAIHRLFRHLPRTRVLHPMSWTAYLAHCRGLADQHPGQRIGLAPLLPSPFNDTRSHTRIWDITRCAAVGLYAANGPYAAQIQHGHNGLLLPLDTGIWGEAIADLYHDADRRLHMSLAAAALTQQGQA